MLYPSKRKRLATYRIGSHGVWAKKRMSNFENDCVKQTNHYGCAGLYENFCLKPGVGSNKQQPGSSWFWDMVASCDRLRANLTNCLFSTVQCNLCINSQYVFDFTRKQTPGSYRPSLSMLKEADVALRGVVNLKSVGADCDGLIRPLTDHCIRDPPLQWSFLCGVVRIVSIWYYSIARYVSWNRISSDGGCDFYTSTSNPLHRLIICIYWF